MPVCFSCSSTEPCMESIESVYYSKLSFLAWYRMAKILFVDDDHAFAESIVAWLKASAHTVDFVDNGEDALQLLNVSLWDIVILDWQMSGISGSEVIEKFRRAGGNTPIILLTGRKDIGSKIHGLDVGADDYVVKPVNPTELAARIRVLLRRSDTLASNVITLGDLKLEADAGRVLIRGKIARLTKKEFAVLEFLLRHPHRAFSAQDILDSVWTANSERSQDAVRQVIRTLRRKLETEGVGDLIKSKPGGGYTIEKFPD